MKLPRRTFIAGLLAIGAAPDAKAEVKTDTSRTYTVHRWDGSTYVWSKDEGVQWVKSPE